MTHLRRQVVSGRTMIRGAVGTAAGGLLLGGGQWTPQAVAAVAASALLDRVVFSRTAGA